MIGRDDCFNSPAKSAVIYLRFGLAAKSKHRQLWNCEIHFATERYNYKYGRGTGAISTFAEVKDLSPSRILAVDLAYKCRLMTCSSSMLCINTCIRMYQSTWNTIIDVKKHFRRGMFTTKPAKWIWTYRQLCSDFLLMCGCSDFALHNLCHRICETFSDFYRSFDNWTV